MKFPCLLGFLTAAMIVSAPALESTPVPKRRTSIFEDMLSPFRGGPKGGGPGKEINRGKLAAEIKLEPLPLKLSASNRMKVTVSVVNRTKKLAQFEFPTTQRIEVLIKSADGKVIEKWSEDQAFASEVSVVTVNPGERAEYVAEVATRDMVAGKSYLVEGFLPQFVELKAVQTLVPEK